MNYKKYLFPKKYLFEIMTKTLDNVEYFATMSAQELQHVMSSYRRLQIGNEEELSLFSERDKRRFELMSVQALTLMTGTVNVDYAMYEHYFPITKWLAVYYPDILHNNLDVIEQKILLLPTMYSSAPLLSDDLDTFFHELFLNAHLYHNEHYQEPIFFDREQNPESAIIFLEHIVGHAMPYIDNIIRSNDPLFIGSDEHSVPSLRDKIDHFRAAWKDNKHHHSLLGVSQREVMAIKKWNQQWNNDDIHSIIQFLECADCDLIHNAFYQKLDDALATPNMEI